MFYEKCSVQTFTAYEKYNIFFSHKLAKSVKLQILFHHDNQSYV